MNLKLRNFQSLVWKYYRAQGRHDLPWRKTNNPYRILVSEIMLQQTQVERVRHFYTAWMKQFPNVTALARAPLGEVLRAWQGLGYNRRAKMLHQAAKELTARNSFPKTVSELEALPGVGPYTARAVAAFAFNTDVVFVETNLRTVILHHFFPRKKSVADSEIFKILEQAFPKGRAREWYAALMDYGAHLKQRGVKTNARVKGYVKQKAFLGSARQARGAILKELAKGDASTHRLTGLLGDDRRAQMRTQLTALLQEGLVTRHAGGYQLP